MEGWKTFDNVFKMRVIKKFSKGSVMPRIVVQITHNEEIPDKIHWFPPFRDNLPDTFALVPADDSVSVGLLASHRLEMVDVECEWNTAHIYIHF